MTEEPKKKGDAEEATKFGPCGIVMPIAGFGDYKTQHWIEIREILERAITIADFKPAPVWERIETDIIQGRIVRNLYEYDMVVCDISGLNPNVMFELGLRLAFKKPVVIVVDDETKIPFDTNAIEHVIYNRDLHFQKTELFIQKVEEKLRNLLAAYEAQNYVAYIDTFGAFSTFEPNPQKVEFDQYVSDKLDQISINVSRLSQEQDYNRRFHNGYRNQPNALSAFIDDQMPDSELSGWSDFRQAKLVELWEEGKSATEIASSLGNVSRNAVIGKAHRLGLKSRPSPPSNSPSPPPAKKN